jgi:hypothetical protein
MQRISARPLIPAMSVVILAALGLIERLERCFVCRLFRLRRDGPKSSLAWSRSVCAFQKAALLWLCLYEMMQLPLHWSLIGRERDWRFAITIKAEFRAVR